MAHSLKKEDLLFYSYIILDESWPSTTKKLGLHEDAIEKPCIELAKKNEYESDIIKLDYTHVSKACNDKKFYFEGLEIRYEDFLEETIIHESVHHIQDTFYDLGHKDYNCVSEGMAEVVSLEVMLEKEKYNLLAWEVITYFLETKKKYKDYLGLPKIHNSLIKTVIEKGDYKTEKRSLSYAKGFFHILEKYGKVNNYLGLLIEPFKDSEME